MTAPDSGGHPQWQFDDAVASVQKRMEVIAGRIEDLFNGALRTNPRTVISISGEVDEHAPENPLRHWRWE